MDASYPVTPWTGTEEDAARALEYEESQIDENNPDLMGKVKYGEYEITTETEVVVPEETDITAETGLIGGELEVIFTPAGDFVTEETESLYYIKENNLEVGSYSASEKSFMGIRRN